MCQTVGLPGEERIPRFLGEESSQEECNHPEGDSST